MRAFFLLLLFVFHFSEGAERMLTLEEALKLTLEYSPTLAMSRQAIEIKRGDYIQSGAYPNPAFTYTVENVFGNKRWKGWDSAETRYELTQTVFLGDKRAHLQRMVHYEISAAFADYRKTELILLNQLKKTFLDLVAAQELYNLALEQKALSEEIFQTVKTKVASGKIAPFYEKKAALDQISQELEFEKVQTELESLKSALALFWGSSCPDFDIVLFPFYHIEPPLCIDHYLDELENHPEMAKARFLYSAAFERLGKEKAERIPDVTLLVGYKMERDHNERGMILGASLPLPIFDSNEGNIYRARSEVYLLNDIISDIELKANSKLKNSHKELLRAYKEATIMESQSLQLAEEGYRSTKEGYFEGKFNYLDLLEAKRTFFEMRTRRIQALLQFLKKNADIEYLTIQGS